MEPVELGGWDIDLAVDQLYKPPGGPYGCESPPACRCVCPVVVTRFCAPERRVSWKRLGTMAIVSRGALHL